MNKKTTTLVNEEWDDQESAMAEIYATKDDLCLHNQTLEDNFLHIKHYQYEVHPAEKVEILELQPFPYEI